jgi:hypothetical protein
MHQLDIISRTMTVLDQRLTNTEDRLSALTAHTRGLVSIAPQTSSQVHITTSGNQDYEDNDDYSDDVRNDSEGEDENSNDDN